MARVVRMYRSAAFALRMTRLPASARKPSSITAQAAAVRRNTVSRIGLVAPVRDPNSPPVDEAP